MSGNYYEDIMKHKNCNDPPFWHGVYRLDGTHVQCPGKRCFAYPQPKYLTSEQFLEKIAESGGLPTDSLVDAANRLIESNPDLDIEKW